MAAFETPTEAARAYGLDPDAVLVALDFVVAKRTSRSQFNNRASIDGANRRRTDDT